MSDQSTTTLDSFINKLNEIDKSIKSPEFNNNKDFKENTYHYLWTVKREIASQYFHKSDYSSDDLKILYKKYTDIAKTLEQKDSFQFHFSRFVYNQKVAIEFLKYYSNLEKGDSKDLFHIIRRYDYGRGLVDKAVFNPDNFCNTEKSLKELSYDLFHDHEGSFEEKYPGVKKKLYSILDEVAAKTVLFQLFPNCYDKVYKYENELQYKDTIEEHHLNINDEIDDLSEKLEENTNTYLKNAIKSYLFSLSNGDFDTNILSSTSEALQELSIRYHTNPMSDFVRLEQEKLNYWLFNSVSQESGTYLNRAFMRHKSIHNRNYESSKYCGSFNFFLMNFINLIQFNKQKKNFARKFVVNTRIRTPNALFYSFYKNANPDFLELYHHIHKVKSILKNFEHSSNKENLKNELLERLKRSVSLFKEYRNAKKKVFFTDGEFADVTSKEKVTTLYEINYKCETYQILNDLIASLGKCKINNTTSALSIPVITNHGFEGILTNFSESKDSPNYERMKEAIARNADFGLEEGSPNNFYCWFSETTEDSFETDEVDDTSSGPEQSYRSDESEENVDAENSEVDREENIELTPEIDFPPRSIEDLGNIEEVPLYPESDYIKDPTDIYEDLSHEEVLEVEDPKDTLERLEKERKKKIEEESNPNELEVMPPQIDDEENSSKVISKTDNQSSKKTALEQAAAWFGDEKNQQSMVAGATVGGFIALGMKVGKNVMQHYSSKHSLQQTASRSALKSSMLNQNQSFSSKKNVKYHKGSFGSAQKSQGAKTYRQPTRGRMGSNGKTVNKFTTGNKVKGPNSYKTANVKNNILDYKGNKKASKISTKALKKSGSSSFSRTGYSLHGGTSSGYIPTSASGQTMTKY